MNLGNFLGVIYPDITSNDRIERIVSEEYLGKKVYNFLERMVDPTPDEYNPREYSPTEKKLCEKIINEMERCEVSRDLMFVIKANVDGKPPVEEYRENINYLSDMSDYTSRIIQRKVVQLSNGEEKELNTVEMFFNIVATGGGYK